MQQMLQGFDLPTTRRGHFTDKGWHKFTDKISESHLAKIRIQERHDIFTSIQGIPKRKKKFTKKLTHHWTLNITTVWQLSAPPSLPKLVQCPSVILGNVT